MRGWIAAMVASGVCGACGHGPTSAPGDAFDPYVYVEGGIKSGSWPNSQPLVFRDAMGTEVTPEGFAPDTVRAPLPNGGSIELMQDNSSSPTARNVTTWWVEGVQPGDHFDFVDPAPPLPADCTARSIGGWTMDSANATWSDADAAHIVARIAGYYRNTGPVPPVDIATWTVVDGLASTSLPDATELKSILVLHCSHATYDDVRTIVGVAGWE